MKPPARLPILLSVPHAGLQVPDYLQPYCRLTPGQIAQDGDEGAAQVYDLRDRVAAFVTTPVARAVVDMNREEHDRSKDGVVKTHTCWDVEIWQPDTPASLLERAIAEFHRPFHAELSRHAAEGGLLLAVDGHTMAAEGPPVGPDPGEQRPLMCLGDGDGACPRSWVLRIRDLLAEQVEDAGEVTINRPFRGGWITRCHGREMPWLQLEVSRTDTWTATKKSAAILAALSSWCAEQ